MKGSRGFILGGLLATAVHAGADTGVVVAGNKDLSATDQPPKTEQSIKIYKYRNRSGVTSFSDRSPQGRRYEIIQLSCFACNLHSTVNWHNIPLQLNAFGDTIAMAARQYSVDPALVRAVIHAESAFKPGAISKKGAQGLMQLMPDTARDMGVVDAMAPAENIQGGVRYLAWLLQRNNGNTLLATAAYNAGPGAVEKYNGIPPFEETQTYVKRVKILYERYKIALASTSSRPQVSQASTY